jgi:hypothetical protein
VGARINFLVRTSRNEMAKTRRAQRKGSRKAHRKGSRKAHRKSHRKTQRGGRGLFSTVYSPVGHVLTATGEAVGTVTNTTRNILKSGLGGLNRIGRSVTGHADMAVRNVVSRKRRASRRANRR